MKTSLWKRIVIICLLPIAFVHGQQTKTVFSFSAGPELTLFRGDLSDGLFSGYRTSFVRAGWQASAQFGERYQRAQWLVGMELRREHGTEGFGESRLPPYDELIDSRMTKFGLTGGLCWGNMDRRTFACGSISQLVGIRGFVRKTKQTLINNDSYHPQYATTESTFHMRSPVSATTLGFGAGTHMKENVLRVEAYAQLGYEWFMAARIGLGLRTSIDLAVPSAR